MIKKEKLLIIGAGGHAKSCIDVIEKENRFEIIGIVDDNPELLNTSILGYTVIGTDSNLEEIFTYCTHAFIGVGQIKTPNIRKKIYTRLKDIGFTLPSIISPLAYVSKHAILGESNIIMHHAIVNACATIGDNNIINTKALVEHDVIVDNHCHLSTASILNGGVHIKSGTFFGSGAVSKEYVSSNENDFIKANSLFLGR